MQNVLYVSHHTWSDSEESVQFVLPSLQSSAHFHDPSIQESTTESQRTRDLTAGKEKDQALKSLNV